MIETRDFFQDKLERMGWINVYTPVDLEISKLSGGPSLIDNSIVSFYLLSKLFQTDELTICYGMVIKEMGKESHHALNVLNRLESTSENLSTRLLETEYRSVEDILVMIISCGKVDDSVLTLFHDAFYPFLDEFLIEFAKQTNRG